MRRKPISESGANGPDERGVVPGACQGAECRSSLQERQATLPPMSALMSHARLEGEIHPSDGIRVDPLPQSRHDGYSMDLASGRHSLSSCWNTPCWNTPIS